MGWERKLPPYPLEREGGEGLVLDPLAWCPKQGAPRYRGSRAAWPLWGRRDDAGLPRKSFLAVAFVEAASGAALDCWRGIRGGREHRRKAGIVGELHGQGCASGRAVRANGGLSSAQELLDRGDFGRASQGRGLAPRHGATHQRLIFWGKSGSGSIISAPWQSVLRSEFRGRQASVPTLRRGGTITVPPLSFVPQGYPESPSFA